MTGGGGLGGLVEGRIRIRTAPRQAGSWGLALAAIALFKNSRSVPIVPISGHFSTGDGDRGTGFEGQMRRNDTMSTNGAYI